MHTLLRTQAFQATSRQLADLCKNLESTMAQRRANQQAPTDSLAYHQIHLGVLLVGFTYCIIGIACSLASQQRQMFRDTCTALVAALHDSQVLEHAARAMLLLAPVVAGGPQDYNMHQATISASRVHLRLLSLGMRCAACSQAGISSVEYADAAAKLRLALSGRCVQTAAQALGSVSLSYADGGSAYGMPLQQSEPLRALLGYTSSRGAHGTDRVGGDMGAALTQYIFAMVRLMELKDAHTRLQAPPDGGGVVAAPGWRCTLAVALRAGWLGVAAAAGPQAAGAAADGGRASSGSDGRGGGGSSSGAGRGSAAPSAPAGGAARGPHTLLQPQDFVPLAMLGLESGCTLLAAREALALRTEWWRLAAAVARHVVPHAGEDMQDQLASFLASMVVADPSDNACDMELPPSPPVEVAAALAGGLLPCLERLLRRAGQAPSGQEARVVRCLLARDPRVIWCFLARLLAYGDPAQTASLVATLGKLLRLVDPRVIVAAAWEPSEDTGQCIVHAACAVMSPAIFVAYEQESTDVSSRITMQRLARSVSYTACHWLPPLSRLVRQALQLRDAVPAARREVASESPLDTVFDMMHTLLGWLPFMATSCVAAFGGTDASAVGRACSGAGGAAAHGSASTPEAATGLAGTAAAPGSDGTAADGGLGVSSESSAAAAGADGHAAADPAAPAAAGAAGGWRRLLLEEVDAVALLGAALELAPGLAEAGAECASVEVEVFLLRLVDGCSAVAAVCVEPGAGEADAAKAGASSASGASPVGPRGGGGAAAAALSCWRPELLRAVGGRLRELGYDEPAEEAEALGAHLAGSGGGSGGEGAPPPQLPAGPFTEAGTLLPPSEARRLLRTCANPGCANLEGDSEAGLSLKACSGCGVAGYCCRACQTAHWRAGHREECKRQPGHA